VADRTANRLYPYPECDPPLTKDASDAPMQTRDLAEAIDADLTVVDDAITDAYQRPSSVLTRSLGTTIASLGIVDWNNALYTDPDITVLSTGFQIITPGLYYSTCNIVQAAGTTLAIAYVINGSGVHRQGSASTRPRASAEHFDVFDTGDTVQVLVVYGGAGAAQSGNFSLTRVART
jgi:hypothetical protein